MYTLGGSFRPVCGLIALCFYYYNLVTVYFCGLGDIKKKVKVHSVYELSVQEVNEKALEFI